MAGEVKVIAKSLYVTGIIKEQTIYYLQNNFIPKSRPINGEEINSENGMRS